MTLMNSFVLHIRSKDCQMLSPPYTTHFEFTFSPAIQCTPEQYMTTYMTSAEIPFTFYTTNQNNQNFILTEYSTADYTGSSTTRNLTIEHGNYTIDEFVDTLQTSMNTNNSYSDTSNYTVQYNPIINKVTMTITGADRSAQLNLTGSNNISRQIGMTETIHNFAHGTPLISDSRCNLATVHALYVKSNLATDQVYESKTRRNNSSILQKIQIDSNPSEMIYFTPNDLAYKSKIGQKYIDTVSFQLTDQNDAIVNLGFNVNFEFSIQVDIHSPVLGGTASNSVDVPSQRRQLLPQPPPLNTIATPPDTTEQSDDEALDVIGWNDEEDVLNEHIIDKKVEEIVKSARVELGMR